MTRRTWLALACCVLVFGTACEKVDAPADPVWGKQACAHCGMLVGDRGHAAQAVARGDRKFFDDIGCMVLWSEAQRDRPEKSWVRSGDAWIDAAGARYATDAATPMDFGLEARAGGSSWDEARAHVLAKGKAR